MQNSGAGAAAREELAERVDGTARTFSPKNAVAS